jgi:hypothetical protein
MLNHEAEENSLTEMEMQIEMRQTLCKWYFHASLKSVDTMAVLLRCVASGLLWSENGLFLQSRYAFT